VKRTRLKKPRVYLYTCVYNRPFDDTSNPRIALETGAFLIVLKEIEKDKIGLVVSIVNVMGNEKNPHYKIG